MSMYVYVCIYIYIYNEGDNMMCAAPKILDIPEKLHRATIVMDVPIVCTCLGLVRLFDRFLSTENQLRIRLAEATGRTTSRVFLQQYHQQIYLGDCLNRNGGSLANLHKITTLRQVMIPRYPKMIILEVI